MEETPAQPQPSKFNSLLYCIIGLLLGIIVIGVLLVFLYLRFFSQSKPTNNQIKPPKPSTSKPIKEPTETKPSPIPEGPVEEDVGPKRIAYIDDYNIWVINSDGSGKKQLTFDGDVEHRYDGVAFKDRDNLSYIKCQRSENCNQIHTLNLKTEATNLEEEISADDYYYLSDFTWSGDGKQLGYMYTDPDQTEFVYVKTGGVTKKIKEIAMPLGGRGGSFWDARYLKFSPDGKKLLVVYTFNLPADEPSIFVFDVSSGAQLLSLGTVGDAWSTHAFFIDTQTVGFKRGDKIMSVNINTSAEAELVTAANNLNPLLSPDGNFIAFWTYTDVDSAKLYLFDVASSSFELGDAMSDPQWLSDQTLVVFTTSTCLPDCMFNYEITGLATFDWADKAKTPLLISSTVSVFTISP